MSRAIGEYTIGFVFSSVLNLNIIQVEHERSYVTRDFVLLSIVYKVIKSIYGWLNIEVKLEHSIYFKTHLMQTYSVI